MTTRTGTIKSLTHAEIGGEDKYAFVLQWDNPDPPPAKLEWEYDDVEKKWYDDAMGAGTSTISVTTDGTPPTISSIHIAR